RNFGGGANQEVAVRLDRQSGDTHVFVNKRVVEDVTDDRSEIVLRDARRIDPTAELSQEVEVEITPQNFGRIAAQTAKQVVLQRLREAERERVYEAFTEREGDVDTGVIQRMEPKAAI